LEKLLTIDEAAEMLALKKPTLYKYVMWKKIPFVKLSARLAFRPSALEKWIDERSFLPAPPVRRGARS
jgi:excisionase family DNA binding protein